VGPLEGDGDPGVASVDRPAHALLLDFDGTISPRDVGHSLFKAFARDRAAWARLVARWSAGALGGRECLEEECALARATREEILAFCAPFRLDPAFGAIVERCRRLGWQVEVLSDGLDLYIAEMLAREGFADVPFRANHVEPTPDGRLVPSFPHAGAGCGRCGTCKGAEARRRRTLGQTVWFAGNGVSDRCAAPAVDRLFAKDDLLAFARREGIAATPFETLADVLAALPEAAAAPGAA
jgi:HAD superfamily phosphoserine phosphatase-like hydrolase